MKQQAVAIRVGWVIEYKGKPWTVVKAVHIKPGKGGAFMQVEMKSVEEGTKTNERFRSEAFQYGCFYYGQIINSFWNSIWQSIIKRIFTNVFKRRRDICVFTCYD